MSTTDGPNAAEVARSAVAGAASLCARTASISPGQIDVYTTDELGCPLLLVRDDSPLASSVLWSDEEVPGLIEVVDLTPAPVAERLRSAVVLAGWFTRLSGDAYVRAALALADRSPVETLMQLGSGWSILRLEVGEVMVRDDRGTRSVEPDDYYAAAPDPLRAAEADLLAELSGRYAEDLARLAEVLGLHIAGPIQLDSGDGPRAPIPVGVDRYGLRLRVRTHVRMVDIQVPWVTPLDAAGNLPMALRQLVERCTACRATRPTQQEVGGVRRAEP